MTRYTSNDPPGAHKHAPISTPIKAHTHTHTSTPKPAHTPHRAHQPTLTHTHAHTHHTQAHKHTNTHTPHGAHQARHAHKHTQTCTHAPWSTPQHRKTTTNKLQPHAPPIPPAPFSQMPPLSLRFLRCDLKTRAKIQMKNKVHINRLPNLSSDHSGASGNQQNRSAYLFRNKHSATHSHARTLTNICSRFFCKIQACPHSSDGNIWAPRIGSSMQCPFTNLFCQIPSRPHDEETVIGRHSLGPMKNKITEIHSLNFPPHPPHPTHT